MVLTGRSHDAIRAHVRPVPPGPERAEALEGRGIRRAPAASARRPLLSRDAPRPDHRPRRAHPNAVGRDDTGEVRLAPLSPADVQAYVDARFGGASRDQ